ncbi:MAG: 2-phospho-L-lactate guanylyltransferase [Euryarchaeota archaeon]|nr:2-phospho-L-lactate guanylyltransferase [Euryarchaeota archaeon]
MKKKKITFAVIPVSRFSHAKTRLSPTLIVEERENLLKAMLKDVIKALKDVVEKIVVISSDNYVLNFVEHVGVTPLKESGETDLNGALKQALDWCSAYCDQVLIIPSDVPLIKKAHVENLIKKGEIFDIVIAPSKGGGTNALLCPPSSIQMTFGDYSFFEHIKNARALKIPHAVYDSFYLSLDVNTAEDLGEIMLHGRGTETRKFLKTLPLKIRSNHGSERLEVKREV